MFITTTCKGTLLVSHLLVSQLLVSQFHKSICLWNLVRDCMALSRERHDFTTVSRERHDSMALSFGVYGSHTHMQLGVRSLCLCLFLCVFYTTCYM